MTTFLKGDWVQVTPTPDKKWFRWQTSGEFYKNFLGKIGQISLVEQDDDGEILYEVCVEFDTNFNDGFCTYDTGSYYAWFKGDHLLKSSEYNLKRYKEQLKAGEELQKWEEFKRKSTDNVLKHIFGPETKENTVDWEEKTPILDLNEQYGFNFDSYR